MLYESDKNKGMNMFNEEEFKRRLEEWIQSRPKISVEQIRNFRGTLSSDDYRRYKALVDEILDYYAIMYLEKVVEKQWYHTIDLGNGEITDGIYDHRPLLKYYGFPESLTGKRVLDVGCADGFFSFEFERRGAEEVVALDAYRNDCFIYAKKKLNSKVKFLKLNVYDLSPSKVGTFDFVFCGTLLLHLSDPIRALRAIRSVINKWEFICATPILGKLRSFPLRFLGMKSSAFMSAKRPKVGVSTYWIPTAKCAVEMVRRAGFDKVEKQGTFTLKGYTKAAQGKERWLHVVVKAIVE